MLTVNQLAQSVWLSSSDAALWLPHILKAADKYQINSSLRLAHFLAQMGHESDGFKHLVENLNYSEQELISTFSSRITKSQANLYGRNASHPANQQMIGNIVYAGRNGNGDMRSGDGYKFRGRGLIMITGRSNYRAVGYEQSPAELELPDGAAMSAAAWWSQHGLNELADKDDLRAITRVINGGYNGLDDRQSRLIKAKGVLCSS
ncbi:glycoside hydrolase family 19 protein [Rosenbergiella australiborealis]|uniref:glycoside hydrolase family 19 protein n=1 Tax=Rosenbergiella australiborealis TaxID=1544696 RepID=UPI001F4DBCF9|nr:glycoside hydrolase family 19 protein [Rosenbergiella australiborealis]